MKKKLVHISKLIEKNCPIKVQISDSEEDFVLESDDQDLVNTLTDYLKKNRDVIKLHPFNGEFRVQVKKIDSEENRETVSEVPEENRFCFGKSEVTFILED